MKTKKALPLGTLFLLCKTRGVKKKLRIICKSRFFFTFTENFKIIITTNKILQL